MGRMSINISRPKERHNNIPNEQVNAALKEPFTLSHPQSLFPYGVAMVMIIILDQQDTVIIAIKIT